MDKREILSQIPGSYKKIQILTLRIFHARTTNRYLERSLFCIPAHTVSKRGGQKGTGSGSATLVKSWVAYPDLVIFQFFPDPAKCSVFYRVPNNKIFTPFLSRPHFYLRQISVFFGLRHLFLKDSLHQI